MTRARRGCTGPLAETELSEHARYCRAGDGISRPPRASALGMELITTILLAGPLGYLSANRWRGLILYLLVWAIVLPIQTIAVHSENPDDINWQYPVVNAAILGAGVALNQLGAAVRARRRSRRPA
jgi:hypothetical protein